MKFLSMHLLEERLKLAGPALAMAAALPLLSGDTPQDGQKGVEFSRPVL